MSTPRSLFFLSKLTDSCSQVIIFGVTATLITVGIVRYTPQTIALASRRAQYYLLGSDADAQLDVAGWGIAEKLGNAHVDL